MALAVRNEVALAESHCIQFGLDPGGLPLQGEALAESRSALDARFHPLSLPDGRVHFVDTAEVLLFPSSPHRLSGADSAKALQIIAWLSCAPRRPTNRCYCDLGDKRNVAQGVAAARQLIETALVVGLDVEWRPDMLRHRSPASIIQVLS